MGSGDFEWRRSLLRRGVFQVHLWLGVALGLYVCVVSLTGAALLFRIDLQRTAFPNLLVPASPEVRAGPADILDALSIAYPTSRIVGLDAPTASRPVYLAYVSDARAFRTVLADPSNGRVLGELPDHSAIHTLQELHFNLLGGETGERINGIGAACLLLLALSGIVIWWQGKGRWARGFRVRWVRNPERRIWELHSAAGIWSVLLIALWAITALSFTFPRQFRAVVNAGSRVSEPAQSPASNAASATRNAKRPALRELIARAEMAMPGRYVARIVLPSTTTEPVQVLFSAVRPTPVGTPDLAPVYLDQYSGKQLIAAPRAETAGDKIINRAGPLHVGSFGGWGVKLAFLCFGLAPSALFITGFITWWRRVVTRSR